MKILDLILKHKWYDMIASGVKKEEYREIKTFYVSRLVDGDKICIDTPYPFKHFDAVRFHRGYTNTTMLLECKGIRIGEGNPDWGAVDGEKYFVISLGNIIQS